MGMAAAGGDGIAPMAMAAPSAENSMKGGAMPESAKPAVEMKIRKVFPESWIFESFNESGLVQLNLVHVVVPFLSCTSR
jgi:hypothetical protein